MINVFNIERFATHDGDGIRTVIFLQGCPMHCPWCANPESISLQPQLLYTKRKCIGCQACKLICPVQAISFINDTFTINRTKCTLCHICEENCLQDAIEIVGKPMTYEEILTEVQKDDAYYKKSGGGITISGGEPFVQYKALKELVVGLKKQGYNIAIETTGMFKLPYLKDIIGYVDTFLFDIKHMDKEILQTIVGGNLDVILYNLSYICLQGASKVVVRVPVIPTFNYDDTLLKKIIRLGKEKQVKEVNLLPYHNFGKVKYEKLLKEYPMGDIKTLQKKDLYKYIKYGKSIGIEVKIGG